MPQGGRQAGGIRGPGDPIYLPNTFAFFQGRLIYSKQRVSPAFGSQVPQVPQHNDFHNPEAQAWGEPRLALSMEAGFLPSQESEPLWPEGEERAGAGTGVKLPWTPNFQDDQPLPSGSIPDTEFKTSLSNKMPLAQNSCY